MAGLFSFHGRTSRLEYLKVQLGLYAAAYLAVVLIVLGVLGLQLDIPAKDIPSFVPRIILPAPVAGVVLAVGSFGLIAVVWATFAVDIRRLHDFGVTGWALLLSFVLAKVVPDPANWPELAPGLGNLVWDVGLLLIPGTAGPNRYDPEPPRDHLTAVF